MKLRTALILVCLGVAALAIAISIKSAPDKAYVTKPFIYGQEDVTRFLSKRGIMVNSVFSLKRNEAGTEVLTLRLTGAPVILTVLAHLASDSATGIL